MARRVIESVRQYRSENSRNVMICHLKKQGYNHFRLWTTSGAKPFAVAFKRTRKVEGVTKVHALTKGKLVLV